MTIKALPVRLASRLLNCVIHLTGFYVEFGTADDGSVHFRGCTNEMFGHRGCSRWQKANGL